MMTTTIARSSRHDDLAVLGEDTKYEPIDTLRMSRCDTGPQREPRDREHSRLGVSRPSFELPPRTSDERSALPRDAEAVSDMRRDQQWHGSDVARRPWTRAERSVVLHGFFGRLIIAVEPLAASVFFAVLPVALLLRRQEVASLLAPIFACAAVGFLAYAIVLILPSARAVLETFAPIYTVDGYIRYRIGKSGQPEYYVAALSAEHETLGEWPLREWPQSIGDRDVWPVMVEFSRYGGIHKVDGHPTGVLPAKIAPFGIGIARSDAENRTSHFR